MTRETLRLAVVGAGRMGRVHLRALEAAPSVEVAAVVEPDAVVREELESAGMRVHATLDELHEGGGVDAALVAAPTDRHRELVGALVTAGLPVLCEKPCCGRSPDTAETIRAAGEAGVVLQIGYWRRFVPELVELRARIAAGEYGELSLVSCWQWDERPPSPGFRERGGGILVDMGVHELDQVRWLTGQEVGRVVALPSAVTSGAPVAGDPDSVQVLAALSAGTIASISLGMRFPPGDSCWVELMGTEGYGRSLFMWGDGGEQVFLDALAAQGEAFAATVLRGAPQAGATGEDALAAIEAAERAAASLAEAVSP
ncbi:MAG TPA: Gfo/Idh/MocA family oxidoreductase [Gaiellaceae bacterium]|nr:Gfo/Idh/MocA family oxidoreductase [Gaiellaceae bacterium]